MKINLGCGFEILAGYCNVDNRAMPGVNVIHDLDSHPWPFDNDCATEIIAFDVFEHLQDVIGAMNECWRILIPGAFLRIRGPVPESENLWVDVSHRRAFVEHSFDHFDWSTDFGRKYRYGVGPWQILGTLRHDGNINFDLLKRMANDG